MYTLGIDIGTTNLNVSLLDLDERRIVQRRSAPNPRFPSPDEYAYLQDPGLIIASVRDMIASIQEPISAMCVTGQVHGILYVDSQGRPLSSLSTWLDRRGTVSLPSQGGKTAQTLLFEKTGIHLPNGYGLLSHYANRWLGLVPPGAHRILGILEYVTGELVGEVLTRSDGSTLGPFGGFDPVTERQNPVLLNEVLDSPTPGFLSPARPFEIAGTTARGIPVTYPVGDNQAGFFGLIARPASTCLVSIGTSGQISVFSPSSVCAPTMELRPYLGLGFLHVGATLCAGKAYEVLQKFLQEVLKAGGISVEDEAVFRMMARSAQAVGAPSPLEVDTAFNGSRSDAHRRGSIRGITLDNLTLGNMVRGTVEGIIRELEEFRQGAEGIFRDLRTLVATGSAVRKNPLFSQELERQFNLELRIPQIDGGAALGAALIAAVGAHLVSLPDLEGLIDDLWQKEAMQ
jgi:sedoheptulokinase